MLAYLKTGKPKSRKKLSKKAKILTLLSNGESVTWKTLRRRFDLQSPRAMVDQLREEGNMVYINQFGVCFLVLKQFKNVTSFTM